MYACAVWVCVLLALQCARALPRSRFYPYGPDHGDKTLPAADDVSSPEIQLSTAIAFYERLYTTVFVNSNGHLSFDTELPSFKSDLVMPIGFKVIAPFLADIDTRLSGDIYYRETQEAALLQAATRDIARHFTNSPTFTPTALFIVTWDEVGYYKNQYDKTNFFQVVIASDGRDSYAFFIYADDGINWIRSQGKARTSLQDVPAQAGFDAGDRRRSVTLPGSGNPEVVNIAKWSNANSPGLWMFRIGNTGPRGDVESPDQPVPNKPTPGPVQPAPGRGTCSAALRAKCHPQARCETSTPGGVACCRCVPPYLGNGQNCAKPGEPQRINGKVSGVVNGMTIRDAELHVYVVTKDGRVYTAVSRMPADVGHSAQSLFAIGGIMGWLFGVSTDRRIKNGYALTGGTFKRSATIKWSSKEELRIEQDFVGRDAQGFMHMDTVLSGKIPIIKKGGKVTVEDYDVDFKQVSPGLIESESTQRYRVGGATKQYSIKQTVRYEGCDADYDNSVVTRLTVARNFIVYGAEVQILRFAMSNRLKLATAVSSGCTSACGQNARCTRQGQGFACVCKKGFAGDGFTCLDENECDLRAFDCHPQADCINTPGSYLCKCRAGYQGDGRNCQVTRRPPPVDRCADLNCHISASCVYDSSQSRHVCKCNTGFQGDGRTCVPVEFTCAEQNNCGPNAECVYDSDLDKYGCECSVGFSGDGYDCQEDIEQGQGSFSCRRCDYNARCIYDSNQFSFRCQCVQGYTGNGQQCDMIRDESHLQEVRCTSQHQCDVNAQCLYDTSSNTPACRCKPGYQGDGRRCESEGCDVTDNCHDDARCMYDSGKYSCVCNPGFTGDGVQCERESCDVRDTCDRNAACTLDRRLQTYSCVCNYGFIGDGRTCRQATDCRRDPGICDINARCEPRGRESYCVCDSGYHGNGRSCAPIGETTSFLLFTQGMSIMQQTFDGLTAAPQRDGAEEVKGQQTMLIPGQIAVGIDVDCYSRYFYWTDVAGGLISRAKLDGTDAEVLLRDVGSPEGIAVDWVGRNMYWTDSSRGTVEVSRLDGSNRKRLVSGLENPRAIQIEPSRGYMFWTDWNRKSPKIFRASMNGDRNITLIDTDIGLPNGLAIDYRTQQICWADAGLKVVECSDYDGRGRRTIYQGDKGERETDGFYPFGMTIADNVAYVTSWNSEEILRVNTRTSLENFKLKIPEGGSGRTYGISTVRQRCPRANNACALNNGGCRFLCLPTLNGGRECACPDNMDERECNRDLLL